MEMKETRLKILIKELEKISTNQKSGGDMRSILVPIFVCLSLVLSSCSAASQPPTPTPTETGIPTATQTTTPVPSGPCDNPLIPLTPGNQWDYTVTSDGNPFEYVFNVGERADIGNINIYVELIDVTHNREVKELVVCKEGAIDNFPLYVVNMLLSQFRSDFLATYLDGNSVSYAPNYAAFAADNWVLSWQPLYHVEETMNIFYPAVGANLAPFVGDEIHLTFNSTGIFEEVTVPGGTFPQALKIFNDITIPGSIDMMGTSIGGDLVIKTTQWYVPYLGLVRAQVDSASIIQSSGASLPYPLASVLEMTGYEPGQ
jgi:hypothetical protein